MLGGETVDYNRKMNTLEKTCLKNEHWDDCVAQIKISEKYNQHTVINTTNTIFYHQIMNYLKTLQRVLYI